MISEFQQQHPEIQSFPQPLQENTKPIYSIKIVHLPLLLAELLFVVVVVAAVTSLVTFKFRFRGCGGGGGDDVKSILGVVAPGAPVTKTVMNTSCVINQKIKVGGAHDLFAFSFSLRFPKINFNFGFSHEPLLAFYLFNDKLSCLDLI